MAEQRARKLLTSIGTIAAAGGLVSLGIFTEGVDAADVAHRIDSSQPKLLVAGKIVAKTVGIAPGDRVERLLELRYGGSTTFRVLTLTVRLKQTSLLTDPTQGLRLRIDRCSRRWSKSSGPTKYTCRGRRVVVLREVPVLGRWKLKRLRLKPRHRGCLRLTLTLPAGAGNALQNQTANLRYRFSGIASERR
jgi:hypothetical protein